MYNKGEATEMISASLELYPFFKIGTAFNPYPANNPFQLDYS